MDYVAVEQLDGDNKYDAGEHGLQVTWELCTAFPITVFSHPLLQLWTGKSLVPFYTLFIFRAQKILLLSADTIFWGLRLCSWWG